MMSGLGALASLWRVNAYTLIPCADPEIDGPLSHAKDLKEKTSKVLKQAHSVFPKVSHQTTLPQTRGEAEDPLHGTM